MGRRAAFVTAALAFAPMWACLRPNPAYLGLTGAASGGATAGQVSDSDASTSTGSSPEPTTTGIALTGGASSGNPTTSDTASSDTGTASWQPSDWSYRVRLTIPQGFATGDLTNAPVCVRLTSDDVDLSMFAMNGQDIRFADDNDTLLPHEIEDWDPNFGGHVWVRIPAITANQPTSWWLYYGNLDVLHDAQDAASLWADYQSVHHFTDLHDSSAHAKDATGSSLPTPVPGLVGGAQQFDGASNYLVLPDPHHFDLTSGVGISAWIKVDGFSEDYRTIVAKGDTQWRLHSDAESPHAMEFGLSTPTDQGMSGPEHVWVDGETPVDDGQWHHIAAAWDQTNADLYIDGELDESELWSNPINVNELEVWIGENSDDPGRFFNGIIDELRISEIPRDPAWHRFQYDMLTDPGFITFGTPEPVP